ncbi:FlgD immunoglobulin-like domain containing protein [Candidatus Eisenbacteria bacterium]|uniref:FlgD immunoglobulin-like domain containing protein n=1 Tax=Eiseniibacteriota bacterium TaxID=2212470 RepID=A0ABV6YKF6_UNCEI
MRWAMSIPYLVGVALLFQNPAGADLVTSESVLGTGGGETNNAAFTLSSTIGQPAVGMSYGSLHKSEAGFWYEQVQDVDSEWANQNINNCVLTVTDQGALGFMDDSQAQGSGFIYPSDGSNQLLIGSLWIGESETYVANRDYSSDPDQEWTVSTVPDGHIWFAENGTSHQDIHTSFTDSAAAEPRNLSVELESWAYATNSVTTHLVILRYTITNQIGTRMDSLYAGVFLDFDVDGSASNDVGSSVSVKNLVYMTDSTSVHVGLSLLHAEGEPPLCSLTLIDNPTYVWPQNYYVLEADKFAFLAADPTHVMSDAPTPSDYSILASAGPFDLEPWGEQLVAFAVMGGETLEDLELHAHVAQMIHESGWDDVAEEPVISPRLTSLMLAAPNPFRETILIRFDLSRPADVNVGIHDIGGRLVRALAHGHYPAMRYVMTWDGRDQTGHPVHAGVYFVRLAAGGERLTRRVICLR